MTETWRLHPDSARSCPSAATTRGCTPVTRAPLGARSRRRPAASRGSGCARSRSNARAEARPVPRKLTPLPPHVADLLAGPTVTDDKGDDADDSSRRRHLVVAPYNLAVHCIRDRAPTGVRVGTVDRFQGQQTPVVLYAMTCSSRRRRPPRPRLPLRRATASTSRSRAPSASRSSVDGPRLLDADCATRGRWSSSTAPVATLELTSPT